MIDDRRQSLEATKSRLASFSPSEDFSIWPERAETARAAADTWRAKELTGDTVGVASAAAQDQLNTVLEAFDMFEPTVSVDDTIVEIDGVRALRFEMSGSGNSAQILGVMARLASQEEQIVIEDAQLFFRDIRPGPITISGYLPVSEDLLESGS